MTEGERSSDSPGRAELLALAGELRPELHRYCARLMGSVIDGEDVVQDTLGRAFVALDGLREVPPLRAWLFRIAHNRALDLLGSRAIRAVEPMEAAQDLADQVTPYPVEMLMRQEAIKTAVSRFAELPILQRSVVILKDVLDEPLAEIAALLGLTVDAVKAHLARGRAGAFSEDLPLRPVPRRGAAPASRGGHSLGRQWEVLDEGFDFAASSDRRLAAPHGFSCAVATALSCEPTVTFPASLRSL